ncbi:MULTISPECIES: DUF418 domain-containing protein [unclassified Bradyrhizobium]|uniref:ATP-dependent DNA ligase n=1 Tax=unclassified Bradyrhizobium TaxID=2631580 RepID=UPI0020B17CFD|nr:MULTISPECIES: DUF418 domain-containing protein [unclassified Bradyrhizobium]MCP3401924.1 DUF418 domain-containing protein [Bradyrhizobium sp. CCGB20]MCP3410409.1 DUF418 domain-containing protein [Bradyrhizobium sp. CCGB01]
MASSIDRVPSGERWIHEIKFDRYRVQLHLVNEAITVFTRRGHDWTKHFKKIANDAWHIKASPAIIDGEIVVPAADGTTGYPVLIKELRGNLNKIVFVAFDLLYLNGMDLRKIPLLERKSAPKNIVAGSDVQFSESFEIDGRAMFTHACKIGLEGVVSKVRDSIYASARGNNWVKKTCAQRETFTIAGFALDDGKWDGIYLAWRKGNELTYAGKVDHGFDKTSEAELRTRLQPLVRKTQPHSKRIAHNGIWLDFLCGLGLFGHFGAAEALAIGLAVYVCQVFFSAGWLRHYRYGLVERLWRTLMYGTQQPMSLKGPARAEYRLA